MLLLTKANRADLPPLYANESLPDAFDALALVKFFDPCGRGTWFATEFDGQDTFFGYVTSPLGSDCDEWGYFSLQELSGVRNRMGLGIERDRHFTPVAMRKVCGED